MYGKEEEKVAVLKVYRVLASVRVLYFVVGCGCVLFAFLALVAALNYQENLVVVLFAAFGITILVGAAVFLFLWPLSRVEITEYAIGSYRFRRGGSLRWEEIGTIKSKAAEGDLILISREGDKRVAICSQLFGFEEIIELLREKRPDLWQQRAFHGRIGVPIFIAFVGVYFLIAAGVSGLGSIWEGVFLILIEAAILFFLTRFTWLADIQGNELRLKSVLRERRIPATEVKSVWLRGISSSMTVSYSVLLELINGKRIPVGNFREGDPVFYNNALKLWLQEQRIQEAGYWMDD